MKRWLLIVALLMTTGQAWADVTGTIVSTNIDKDGNIEVHAQYAIDGVTVPVPPGQSDWISHYNVASFAGLDQAHIIAKVHQDMTTTENALLRRQYFTKADAVTDVSFLVGQTTILTSATLLVDSGSTGTLNTQWTVFTDGHRAEAPYTPAVTSTP